MKIEILSDVHVPANIRDKDVVCTFPTIAVEDNDVIVCSYRQGGKMFSDNGILLVQESRDKGKTWLPPTVAFDGRSLSPPRSVISGGICRTAKSSLLLAFKTLDVTQPGIYAFSPEGIEQKLRNSVTRSEDSGKTWSQPMELDMSGYKHARVNGSPVVSSNGDLLVPVEFTTDCGPNGTAAALSTDDGHTFEPFRVCVADSSGEKNWCDARCSILPDGRILMLLWTFLQKNEETITVHQSYSSDNGRTWSAPQPTGMAGQVTSPLVLPSGAVIAVGNYRHVPQGSRLYLSLDKGETWDGDHPIQMWDARQQRMLGEPIDPEAQEADKEGVWNALQKFTFGYPGMVSLSDGSIVLTYWASIDSIRHVRACRFRINEI